MNDPRNMQQALRAVRKKWWTCTRYIRYTTSPVHTLETWLDTTEQLLEIRIDSLVIKDMSGILSPVGEAYKLKDQRNQKTLQYGLYANTVIQRQVWRKWHYSKP